MAHKTLGIPSKADGTMGGVPVGGVAGPAEELERRTPFATQTREVGEVLGMHSVGPKRHPEEVAVPARGGGRRPHKADSMWEASGRGRSRGAGGGPGAWARNGRPDQFCGTGG